MGFFVFFQNKKGLLNQLFFIITVLFSVFTFADLVLWATGNPPTTMFAWTMTILVEPMIYFFAFYFAYVFIKERDLSTSRKFLLVAPLFITVLLTPTRYALMGFNFSNCDREAVEGVLVYYGYFIEVLYVLGIAVLGVREYFNTKSRELKNKILLFIIGILLFLLAFAFGNIIGTITVDWTFGQYGFIGMPIFIGFLSYLIVRYKTFNTKIIGSEILVVALWFLVFATLFVQGVTNIKIILVVTLVFLFVIGILLIRSVKRQISQNERLDQLRLQLEKSVLETSNANEKLKGLDKLKTEFLSLASHQLRSPLTAIKGYASMLDEGGYGKLADGQDEVVRRIYASAQSLTSLVEDLLNVSKIEQGGMKYDFSPVELKKIMMLVYHDMEIPAKNKGLDLRLVVDESQEYIVSADATKIKQVILNLIDNSIKYTPKGFVEVSLKKNDNNTITFAVRDSGVGITAETKEKLFQKFSRGEGGKLNTGGSGLGLYLAKEIAIAHKGDVDIFSEGQDKGATFSMTLPMITS